MSAELQNYKSQKAAMAAANKVRKQLIAPGAWTAYATLCHELDDDRWIWELTHYTVDLERITLEYYPSTKQYQAASLIDNEDFGFQEADADPQQAAERLLTRLIEGRRRQLEKLTASLHTVQGLQ